MSCSPKNIFTWVGAILINVGFVALISWGASTLWYLGFFFSAFYSGVLFALAYWVQKHEYDSVRPANGEASTEEADLSSPETTNFNATPSHKMSLLLNLIYGLAMVSLGVTFYLPPINLIKGCSDQSLSSRWEPSYSEGWITNTTALPESVREWAQISYDGQESTSSYAYLSASKILLFRANSEKFGYLSYLAVSDSSNAPTLYKEYQNPGNFITVSNSTACFTSVFSTSNQDEDHIYCSDGTIFRPANTTGLLYEAGRVRDFIVDRGLLWFKQDDNIHLERGGSLVFSLDPSTMKTQLYSYKGGSDDDGNDSQKCDPTRSQRMLFVVLLFVDALPVTLLSATLWYMRQIPSMAVTTYLGLASMYVTVYGVLDPELYQICLGRCQKRFEWYFCLTGSIWIVVLSYFNLSRRTSEIQKHPLQWGLVVAALGFMGGTWSLLPMEKDRFIDWFALNLCVFVPLLLFGMVDSNMFLLVLGCIGLFADAGRFAQYVGNYVGGDAQAPVFFVVFVLTGLLAGVLGYQLTKWQCSLQGAGAGFVLWLDSSILSHWCPFTEDNLGEENPAPMSLVSATSPDKD